MFQRKRESNWYIIYFRKPFQSDIVPKLLELLEKLSFVLFNYFIIYYFGVYSRYHISKCLQWTCQGRYKFLVTEPTILSQFLFRKLFYFTYIIHTLTKDLNITTYIFWLHKKWLCVYMELLDPNDVLFWKTNEGLVELPIITVIHV